MSGLVLNAGALTAMRQVCEAAGNKASVIGC
jgi:hypothetical protein